MLQFSTHNLLITFHLLLLISSSLGESEENLQGRIKLRLYDPSDSNSYAETDLENLVQFLESSRVFDPSKQVVILFQGLNMDGVDRHMTQQVKAFGRSGKSKLFNIMALQMASMFKHKMADSCNELVIQNCEFAGNLIGQYLIGAIDSELIDPSMLLFVGFGIGAHTAGYAARAVGRERQPIRYILGLDPLGSLFCPDLLGFVPVSSGDAQAVHLFHTNTDFFGSSEPLGTADFYFNGGENQPNCLFSGVSGCSHARAVSLFVDVILYDDTFVARKCSNLARLTRCLCMFNELGVINFPPDYSLKGVYQIMTRERSPFGVGDEGVKCFLEFWK